MDELKAHAFEAYLNVPPSTGMNMELVLPGVLAACDAIFAFYRAGELKGEHIDEQITQLRNALKPAEAEQAITQLMSRLIVNGIEVKALKRKTTT